MQNFSLFGSKGEYHEPAPSVLAALDPVQRELVEKVRDAAKEAHRAEDVFDHLEKELRAAIKAHDDIATKAGPKLTQKQARDHWIASQRAQGM